MKDEPLIHFGVSGMKWGVRRRGSATDGPKNFIERGREKSWTKKAMSIDTYVKVHNKVSDELNATHISRINNKPEYKNKNFNDPKNAKLYAKYNKEFTDISVSLSNKFYKEVAGISPYSGNRVKVVYDQPNNQTFFELVKDSTAHSESNDKLVIVAKLDSNGYIVSFEIKTDSDTLTHWGIPGMKWGIRRRQSNETITGKPHSSDHTTAVSLKKKHISEMSNDELKKLTTRMQLEKQYKDLSKTDISAGQKFVTEIIGNVGKQIATKYISDAATQGLPAVLKILKTSTGG